MTGGSGGTPLKVIQEGAMEIYRSIMPALRRCSSFRNPGTSWMPGLAERRANHQQSENIKWQQDMFLRLVNMSGLCQEGLIKDSDVASFRQKILDNIVVCYDGGEYPQVTRDKLIFLQELLHAKCISEDQYHTVKKSLLYRLAAQGAEINSSDIVLTCSAEPLSAPSTPLGRKRMAELSEQVPPVETKNEELLQAQRTKNSKSPVKHFMEAMSRLKHGGKVHNEPVRPRVPHAMDFIRPRDCPARDPPTAPEFDISDQCGSPLFYSPSGSVSSKESSSKREPGSAARYRDETSPRKTPVTRTLFPAVSPAQKSPLAGQPQKSPLPPQKSAKSPLKPADSGHKTGRLLTDIMRKLHIEDAETKLGEDKAPETSSTTPKQGTGSTTPRKPWRLDLLRPPRIITNRQEESVATDKVEKTDSSSADVLSPNRAPRANPDTVKLKKKFHSRGASTEFFIDKVLGENIKKELEHIRIEISKTNSTQTFTNDQIDAIATRLPADKSELMRFFPKSWCDRYGDIVLDVVHKEFKGHIKDMETSRKNTKDKQQQRRPGGAENDENSGSTNNNISCDGVTISKATSKLSSGGGGGTAAATTTGGKNKAMNRCFTTTDESSPRSRGRVAPRKVTSFNTSVEHYEKELDGKLCAEIEKLPHRKTPLRV